MKSNSIIPIIPQNFNVDKQWISRCKEVSFELHSKCNLKCEFCCQQSWQRVNLSKDQCERQLNNFKKLITHITSSSLVIHIMGGELFRHDTSDEEIAIIDNFTTRVIEVCNQHNIVPHIQYVTNLLTSNLNQIIYLLNKHNGRLMVSFDLEGRYTKEKQIDWVLNNLKQLDLFNIEYSTSFIITKLVKEYIEHKKGGYRIFEYLYNTHPDTIGWEIFDNQLNKAVNKKYHISYKQYGEFLKFCYDNYPNLSTIQRYTSIVLNKTKSDKTTHQFCKAQCAFTPFHQPFYHCHTGFSKKFFKNYPCVTCKHFSYCLLQCFRQATFQENNQYCAIQDLMNYIENDHANTNNVGLDPTKNS